MSDSYTKPIPVPDEMTQEFWTAAKNHELAFQRCQHCGTYAHPPVLFCRSCANVEEPRFEFERVSGRGRIVNWTVMHDAMVVGFEAPWVNITVELVEQPRLYFVAMLDDGPDPGLEIGSEVEVVFTDITDDISLPSFRLVSRHAIT